MTSYVARRLDVVPVRLMLYTNDLDGKPAAAWAMNTNLGIELREKGLLINLPQVHKTTTARGILFQGVSIIVVSIPGIHNVDFTFQAVYT